MSATTTTSGAGYTALSTNHSSLPQPGLHSLSDSHSVLPRTVRGGLQHELYNNMITSEHSGYYIGGGVDFTTPESQSISLLFHTDIYEKQTENVNVSLSLNNTVIQGMPTSWTIEHNTLSNGNLYFICAASFVIAATILGNILVIVAVVTEKRLRKVGNSFIVSLAVSDLLVGLVVTPVALLYHLSEKWTFGLVFCDIWVSLDVICCTASIVNLCVISFDRYNAITRPLRYALKRTPKRALSMIILVWTYSILIAVPPLIGWREHRPLEIHHCAVSKNVGYTIFSTVGAFYTPLIVMLVMYAKIFYATVKRKRNWVPGPAGTGGQHRKKHEFAVLINATDSVRRHYQNTKLHGTPDPPKRCHKSPTINPRIGYRLMRNGLDRLTLSEESIADFDSESPGITPSPSPRPSLRITTIPSLSVSSTSTLTVPNMATAPNGLCEHKRQLKQFSSGTTTTTTTLDTATSLSYEFSDSNCKPRQTFFHKSFKLDLTIEAPSEKKRNHRKWQFGDISPLIKKMPTTPEHSQVEIHSDVHETTFNTSVDLSKSPTSNKYRKKNRISLSQEKTAAKTLGIIIGGFTLCWLPFFVITLVSPMCSKCNPKPLIKLVFTWLGYFNSALNPFIYTFFNPYFRKAFRRILCCYCCKKR